MKIWALLCLILISCQDKKFKTKDVTSANVETTLQDPRQRWMERVLQKIRLGKGIRSTDPMEEWLKLSDEEFIEVLLNQDEFEDTLLDMTLTFYGQRKGVIRDPKSQGGNYSEEVFLVPQALEALKAYKGKGNYFEELTLLRSSVFIKPLETILATQDRLPDRSTEESRQVVIQKFENSLERIKTDGENLNLTNVEFCDKNMFTDDKDGYFDYLYRIGMTNLVNEYFTENFWLGNLYDVCNNKKVDNFDRPAEVRKLYTFSKKLIPYLTKWSPDVYKIKTIKDILALPADLMGTPTDRITSTRVRTDIEITPNTSTNMNRKRAAFVLKNFFCDDLTPLNVATPDDHTLGRHGSDPSCFACHYKLDPMAGFFRNKGRYFRDYSNQENILLSDDVSVNRTEYIGQWKKIPGDMSSSWNIGYIRSATDESRNSYGESLEDLERILSTAPEVKACFVKRTFEYFLGNEQAVSPGYLDYLTKEFQAEIKTSNSAKAVKKIITKILLSKSFTTFNRNAESCYDEAPGPTPSASIPCQVSSLIQKRCSQCHKDSGPSGGLSLSGMIEISPGIKGFKHIDRTTGLQLSKKDSFGRIIDRINSSDPDYRMPFGGELLDTQRSKLYLWAQQEMNQ